MRDCHYGWAPIGTNTPVIQELKGSRRWSILPAFTIEGYIAHEIHHGSVTSKILNAFIKIKVLPFCTGGNGPQSVLVMDNASSYQNKELANMCHEADVLLPYLSLYLLDFNPIKTSFSVSKRWIKRHINLINFYTKKVREFGQFLYNIVRKQANDIEYDAGQLFWHLGTQYPKKKKNNSSNSLLRENKKHYTIYVLSLYYQITILLLLY